MRRELEQVRVIRETLETSLSGDAASSILFTALDRQGGDLPSETPDLLVFVEGPLRKAIEERTDRHRAEELSSQIRQLLELPGSTGEHEVVIEVEDSPRGRDADSTRSVPVKRRPVYVIVVAGGEALARRLAAALGPARVAPGNVSTLEALAKASRIQPHPAMLIVDGSDIAPIKPRELVEALTPFSTTTLRVVWAMELPYGKRMYQALDATGTLPVLGLVRDHGIDPVLDLIRSRRRNTVPPE